MEVLGDQILNQKTGSECMLASFVRKLGRKFVGGRGRTVLFYAFLLLQ